MKKSKNLLIAVSIILALIIGFLVGISVDYPKIDKDSLTGTIGRVKNYRNTKVTEADIQLQNELLSDTLKLEILKNYFSFYYSQAVRLEENIQFTVSMANECEAFKNKNQTAIASIDGYGKFLTVARKELLKTAMAFQAVKEVNPILLNDLVNEGSNVIARIKYGNKTIIDFIDKLDAFIQAEGITKYPGICEAHDRLTLIEASSALVLNDKIMQKYLNKKSLYSKKQTKAEYKDMKEVVQKDTEELGWHDSEKLGVFDAEKLGWFDAEKLGRVAWDVEKLGGFFDIEIIGGIVYTDAEKLGRVADSENLGSVLDIEKLGSGSGTFDAEKLGFSFGDAEKLGINFFDAEKLGWWDAEQLGSHR